MRKGSITSYEELVALTAVTPAGCWQWTRSTNVNGYAQVWYHGAKLKAHRIAYEHAKGPIPDGLVIDHLCRNRACINPAHLEAVTSRENILRGEGATAHHARKSACLRGHELAGANLYIRGDGARICRRCDAIRTAKYQARLKEEKAA